MVRVQRLTGMRPQEVVLMRAADIDMSDPTCWIYRPERHKSEHHEREREIFIGPRARELLRPYLDVAPTGYLFSPRRAEEQRRMNQRARRKSPLTPSQRALVPGQIPRVSPVRFTTTAATGRRSGGCARSWASRSGSRTSCDTAPRRRSVVGSAARPARRCWLTRNWEPPRSTRRLTGRRPTGSCRIWADAQGQRLHFTSPYEPTTCDL